MNDTRHRDPWPAHRRRPIRRNARGFGRGGGGGGPVPFTPDQQSGLEAWYRGDSYAGGVAIDLSGKGRNGSAVGSAPGQVARAGQLAFSFSGTGRLVGAFGTVLAQPLTTYAVWEVSSTGTAQAILDGDDSTNRNYILVSSAPAVTGGAPVGLVGGVPNAGQIYASALVANGVTSAFFDRSNFVAPGASGNGGSAGLDGITIGAAFNGSSPLTGFVWEVIVYSGAHDAATRAKLAGYFNARYAGLQIAT